MWRVSSGHPTAPLSRASSVYAKTQTGSFPSFNLLLGEGCWLYFTVDCFQIGGKKIFSANGCHVGNIPHMGGELSAQPEVTPMSCIWCFLGSIPAGKRGWGHSWRCPHAGSGSLQWSTVAGAYYAHQVIQQVSLEGLLCAILGAHRPRTERDWKFSSIKHTCCSVQVLLMRS